MALVSDADVTYEDGDVSLKPRRHNNFPLNKTPVDGMPAVTYTPNSAAVV